MKLRSITVRNFRSIKKAEKIPLASFTTLLGANNEGKSNVLRALVLAMSTVLGQRSRLTPRRPFGPPPEDVYDWERDFPVALQAAGPHGKSEFVLEFDLSKEEEDDFAAAVGSKVKTPLPIEVQLGAANFVSIAVKKRGPGSAKVTEKKKQITAFLKERLDFDYIPAVRTADTVDSVMRALLRRVFHVLDSDPDYLAAQSKIREIQRPIVSALSGTIRDTLAEFLPTVASVTVDFEAEGRSFDYLQRVGFLVDDGSETELRYKGDGVQSLAALALLRFASNRERGEKEVILAVEEPESHLHPRAIHALRDVLLQLAKQQQVIVTTHCHLFVDRANLASTVIVERGKARAATTVNEIRDVLGVRPADNLLHAELVLVVEGEDDRIALTALLGARSAVLANAFAHNRLAVDTLGGASNLAYKLGLLRNGLCQYVCYMDGDAEGDAAVRRATQEGLLDESSVCYARLPHLDETELEDLIDASVTDAVLVKFGVVTLKVATQYRKKKWSDRARSVFLSTGKIWDSSIEARVKLQVAEAVAQSPNSALRESTSASVDNLIVLLEKRLAPSA
jgi:energy-coupling factor transporter ATP-binding protein EcfA2